MFSIQTAKKIREIGEKRVKSKVTKSQSPGRVGVPTNERGFVEQRSVDIAAAAWRGMFPPMLVPSGCSYVPKTVVERVIHCPPSGLRRGAGGGGGVLGWGRSRTLKFVLVGVVVLEFNFSVIPASAPLLCYRIRWEVLRTISRRLRGAWQHLWEMRTHIHFSSEPATSER
jgi:hypothetical protein